MENPIKMDDLGKHMETPYFWKHPICTLKLYIHEAHLYWNPDEEKTHFEAHTPETLQYTVVNQEMVIWLVWKVLYWLGGHNPYFPEASWWGL